MELQQQHGLPRALERLARVDVGRGAAARADGGRRRPQLGLAQQGLVAAVALLGSQLRGEDAAVQLEVHLAAPHGRLRVLGLGILEELPGGADRDPRRPLEVRGAVRGLDHLAGRPAAAVAPAEGNERGRGATLLREVALGVRELFARQLADVGVDGREVREDARAVDALPPEGVVRHGVDLVPRDLLRQEPARPGGRDDLRQGARVAERVGHPGLLALDPELIQEELLARDELAGHRLAAGHVGVTLDPHAADGNELPRSDLLADAGEHLRVVLLHPEVLLGARAREHEVGVLVHEVHDVGERAGALAHGLAQRPQPGRVDVGVAGGENAVGARRGGLREGEGQRVAAGLRGRRDALRVEHVEHVLQRTQNLVAPRRALGQLVHEPAQGPDVGQQVPDGLVAQGHLELLELVQRLVGRGLPLPVRRGVEGVLARDVGVGGGLDEHVDLPLTGRDRQPRVERRDRLDERAVGPVGEPFGLEARARAVVAEIDEHLDARAGGRLGQPGGGHLARHPQPHGRPRAAPAPAERHRLEGLPDGGLEGHGLALDLPRGRGERVSIPIQRRLQMIAHEAIEAGDDEGVVLVHGRFLLTVVTGG